jgi:hypothetical protein
LLAYQANQKPSIWAQIGVFQEDTASFSSAFHRVLRLYAAILHVCAAILHLYVAISQV